MTLMVTATAAAASTPSAHRVEGNVGSPMIGSGSVGDVLWGDTYMMSALGEGRLAMLLRNVTVQSTELGLKSEPQVWCT